ncbi:MAG: AtpZ/AtpI family protein [Leptospira sp.]|nr:AtpZ/AtpI family protein [Leptospira sp.]
MEENRKNTEIKPRSIWSMASLGTEFTAIILFFILGGSWLDQRYNSSPFILLLGMLLGFGLGLFHVIRRSKGFYS